MALTQQQIADHLDLAQQNVSAFVQQLDFDWRSASLDEVRIAYIRKLRAQAAGHRSEDGLDLVRERVMTERVDRDLKIYTLAEKKGQLINVAQLEPELMQMFGAFKSELLSRDDKLKSDLDALYGIEVDVQVLNDHTFAALNHLARYDAGDQGAVVTPGENAGAAGEGGADGVGAQA
jgi:hypothetical protein